MKKKATKKCIGGGRTVVTNPKFTRDEDTPMPLQLVRDRIEIENQLRRSLEAALFAGIAIGRARATKSGRRAK